MYYQYSVYLFFYITADLDCNPWCQPSFSSTCNDSLVQQLCCALLCPLLHWLVNVHHILLNLSLFRQIMHVSKAVSEFGNEWCNIYWWSREPKHFVRFRIPIEMFC